MPSQPSSSAPRTKPAAPLNDPSHLVIGGGSHPLDAIFSPKCVAVVGASEREGSVGRAVFANLLASPFGGIVFPVNAQRSSILGVHAYPDLASLPSRPDLVVIAVPAQAVPGVIHAAGLAGVRGAVVLSAGFSELGAEGVALERAVAAEAAAFGIRMVGPNCLGVLRPATGLNASFAARPPKAGNVAFISQSGALLTAILDWSLREQVGFSTIVSAGSMADVGWGDLISFLGDDPHTQSILIYMESVGQARAFLSAAREVALTKPILVLKAGRSAAGAKAAASHTGSLVGSDDVLEAAFKRCGVMRVDTIAELFNLAEALAKQPRPKGPRLTVLTNAGGPGVLAADALSLHGGGLAPIPPATLEALNKVLPGPWSHGDPVDVLGDASPERYKSALEIALANPESDGLLAILTPQAMTDPTATAQAVASLASVSDKPILASWMGGSDVAAGEAALQKAGIPCYAYPDEAVSMFCGLWRYSERLQALYETPVLEDSSVTLGPRAKDSAIAIREASAQGRTLLSEHESKRILANYGIPVSQTRLADTAADAAAAAKSMGFPVAVKLNSLTVTHKAAVGGVKLNLKDETEVAKAFQDIRQSVDLKTGPGHFQGVCVQPMARLEGVELLLGMTVDPQFGPVIVFGAGGALVEVWRDRALALPPLNSTLARRLLEQPRIYEALKGANGKAPVDFKRLEEILIRFSQMVLDLPRLKEVDINPLLVSSSGVMALDARMVLVDAAVPDADLPKPALRPYPSQYIQAWRSPSGEELVLRPIRPEDEPLMVKFHETLSERSVYQRYAKALDLPERVSHERMVRICMSDFDRQIALVAERKAKDGAPELVGAGRLTRAHGQPSAKFALLVADAWQGRGLGSQLLKRLIEVGRAEGLRAINAEIFPDNGGMQAVCRKLEFSLENKGASGLVEAVLNLGNDPGHEK